MSFGGAAVTRSSRTPSDVSLRNDLYIEPLRSYLRTIDDLMKRIQPEKEILEKLEKSEQTDFHHLIKFRNKLIQRIEEAPQTRPFFVHEDENLFTVRVPIIHEEFYDLGSPSERISLRKSEYYISQLKQEGKYDLSHIIDLTDERKKRHYSRRYNLLRVEKESLKISSKTKSYTSYDSYREEIPRTGGGGPTTRDQDDDFGGYGAHFVTGMCTGSALDRQKPKYRTVRTEQTRYTKYITAKGTGILRLNAEEHNKLHPRLTDRLERYREEIAKLSQFVEKKRRSIFGLLEHELFEDYIPEIVPEVPILFNHLIEDHFSPKPKLCLKAFP